MHTQEFLSGGGKMYFFSMRSVNTSCIFFVFSSTVEMCIFPNSFAHVVFGVDDGVRDVRKRLLLLPRRHGRLLIQSVGETEWSKLGDRDGFSSLTEPE